MLALRTILHPTDFSDPSEYAFRLACSLARDHGAKLVVLHVDDVPAVSLYEGVGVVQQLEKHERMIQKKLDELTPPAGVACERLHRKGDPADAIMQLARELPADLIVMGTHGRTGLFRVLAGSVAERVLREAACPVLAVRTPLPGALA